MEAREKLLTPVPVLMGIAGITLGFAVAFSICGPEREKPRPETVPDPTAELNECRNTAVRLLEGLKSSFDSRNHLDCLAECEQLPACPSPPVCPSPFNEQIAAVAENCDEQLGEVQSRWDAKLRLANEAIEAAKALKVGPRLREWIAVPEAQLAAREVLLSYEDWRQVDSERAAVGEACIRRMHDIVRELEPAKRYAEAGRSSYERHMNDPIRGKIDALFPDWMRYQQMELELTREAVGCLDDEEPRRSR